MLSRLILLLLLACLALPAMASEPCHDGSTEMSGMAMPHMMPDPASDHDRKAVAVHACMGCIPPASLLRAPIEQPVLTAALNRRVALVRFEAGRMTPPATPPPRPNA